MTAGRRSYPRFTATNQPVCRLLYPNEHYTTVGDAVAQGDIDACMTWAKEHVKAGGADAQKAEEVAKQTGFGAASGAAIGAIGGAVGGGGAGQGVAVGAATGATAGSAYTSRGVCKGSMRKPVDYLGAGEPSAF